MPRSLVGLLAAVCCLLAGCATQSVRFPNANPVSPLSVPAALWRPAGEGPFPAVMLLHGCHGVTPSTRAWGRWFRDRGYVALVVDSWAARGMAEGCSPGSPDLPSSERFDDAVGALRWLQGRGEVARERIGVMGWSNGGLFAMSLVNGPTHERARRRGVTVPEPGIKAAVAFYPGGCYSLVHELVVRPLLVLLGDADDWTLPGPCQEMVNAMRSRGADASIVLYPGVYHYFDVEGQPRAYLPDVANRNKPGECCGATVSYDAAADSDARRRVAEFFGYHLRPGPGR
jgi:dienelactone hydrolase